MDWRDVVAPASCRGAVLFVGMSRESSQTFCRTLSKWMTTLNAQILIVRHCTEFGVLLLRSLVKNSTAGICLGVTLNPTALFSSNHPAPWHL